jgi:hypothetical protein
MQNTDRSGRRNNVLFGGVVVSFLGVLSALIPGAHVEQLVSHADWHHVPRAIPTLLLRCVWPTVVKVGAGLRCAIVLDETDVVSSLPANASCVYHNIIGSVAARLGSVDRVRNVVLVGSGIPLAMFIAAKFVLHPPVARRRLIAPARRAAVH